MDSRSKKRVLVIHASAGQGHKKAAIALGEAVKAGYPKASVEVIDALDFCPAWFKKAYAGTYLFLIDRLPLAWGLCYLVFDLEAMIPPFRSVRNAFNSLIALRLVRKLLEEQPDVVFTTHFMGADILAGLKRSGKLKSRCVTVVTDFLVHRFWVFKQMDRYTGATERTKHELVRLGVDPAKIRVTGIPIEPKFAKTLNRGAMAGKLGARAELFTLLFTSGGSATGPLKRVIDYVTTEEKNVQVLVVCGSNAALKEEIDKIARTRPQIKTFGFVNNMDELMEASDGVVGKAGGLTVSEALAKRKLIFILSPVPGQETHNAQSLVDAHAGVWVRNEFDLLTQVHNVLKYPRLKEQLLEGVEHLRKPESAAETARAGMEEW